MFSNQKSAHKFYCEKCDYGTCKKSSYDDHLTTRKHKKADIINKNQSKICQLYICQHCNKSYKDNSGLWRHKKKCKTDTEEKNLLFDKDLMRILINDNTEMKQLMIKILETGTINNNNSHNITNSNNKAFNLNFYLNETCKHAMNITDFIDSIQVNLDDLENTGRKGYIEGISNIFVKNLNDLEDHMRPLHCSDLKREILYVKDNNEWMKETNNKPILTKAIKTVACENIKQIKNWRDKYPDCTNSDSQKNDLYLKIVSNSMNGSTQEESNKNISKIISNLAKEVVIDKENFS
jgi:hypothetical protein